MNITRIWIGLISSLFMACGALAAINEAGTWSAPTNGLQARLTFVERPKLNGTRFLVPYLELKNVRDLAHPMDVQCDSRHLQIELVDAEGRVVRDGSTLPRSGPVPDLSTVS